MAKKKLQMAEMKWWLPKNSTNLRCQVRLNRILPVAFPLKFPTLLKDTKYKVISRARAFHPAEYPLNRFCMFFFFFPTRAVGDAQVLVPKPERLWVPQIEQGVLV